MSEAQDFGAPAGRAPPWAGVTLVDLFASAVQLNGAAIAYREAPVAGGPGRSRTYGEANESVERLRLRIEDLGLQRGSVVVVCLPAAIEAPLTLLALLRAGLTPCLVPPTAGEAELARIFQAASAQAAITCAQVGSLRPADVLRAAAVSAGGPRYVLGFGERLPAGVIPLSDDGGEVRETSARDAPPAGRSGGPSVLTVELAAEGPSLYVHDQEALVSLALSWVLAVGAGTADTVLTTLSPMTQAGLVPALAPLLVGGTLALQPVFTGEDFLACVSDLRQPHLVAPGALVEGLHKAGLLGGAGVASTTLLHRPPLRLAGGPSPQGAESPVIDMLALGERTLLLARRDLDGRPTLSLAEARIPEEDGGLVLACRQDGALRISVSGASVAAKLNERMPDRDTDWALTPFIASLDKDGLIATIIRVNSPVSFYPAPVT